jgi:serine/threonine protein kinase
MLPLPSRISRYDIKSLIGTGGMGTLYLARDTNPNTNRLVALKLLNANLDSGDLRERFAREARALAALNHPNIVNIYDSGEFQGSPFIVMEYVRGETLSEKIKRKAPLSLGQKLKLMGELCAGLGHAHEAGMIHRDIKPANLMVDQHGRLKILDFGIARVSEGSFTRAGLQVTQFNVRIGTPGYMSPEQIETGEIDRRSDIFAVGAVFYELLSNSEAFSGASTRQIENKVLQAQPAPLTALVPGLDPEIAAIVARALEKDPAKRYQDAVAMEEALEQQLWRLGRQDTPAPTERPTPPPQSAGRKSRDSRADAAFQRSAAFYREGAVEAARRFAIEALAEDPHHEGAYTFLERLERQEPARWPIPRPSLPPPGTELRTALEPPARQLTPVPPTILSPRRDSVASSSAKRSQEPIRWRELWSRRCGRRCASRHAPRR